MVSPDDEIIDRLLALGAAALSEVELVTAIIGGKTGEPALEKARILLEACGGIQGLLTCNHDIARAQQLDRRESAAVLAAVELSRRLARIKLSLDLLEDPEAVARFIFLQYGQINQILLGAIFVDVHNRPLGHTDPFRGTHHSMAVEPGPILREAIRHNANGVLVFHIHPSGDPTPSEGDFSFALRMKDACQLIGLELLDYLVLGGGKSWTSIRRLKPW